MSNSSAPKNPDRAHDDNSWEQLEAELFGIPYTKEHVPAPEAEPAESRFDEPAEPAPEPTVAEIPPEPAPTLAPAADPEAPSDEFGFAESPPASVEAQTPSPTQPQPGEESSDSYWNALENFDWTQPSDSRPRGREEHGRPDRGRPPRGDRRRDESRGPRRDSGRRDGGGRRPERPHGGPPAAHTPAAEGRPSGWDRPAPRTQPQPQPSPVEDDFGQGLIEEARTPPVERPQPVADERRLDDDTDFTLQQPTAVTEPTSLSPPAGRVGGPPDSEQGDHRRRRRRRRRGRGGEGRAAPAPTDQKPPTEPLPVEPFSSTDDDWTSDADEPEDDFETIEEPSSEPAAAVDEQRGDPRSRRRRGRSHRGDGDRSETADATDSGSSEELPSNDLVVESAGAVSRLDDESEDDAEELDVSYGHVPSWEEAISYLLNPSLVETAAASSEPQQPVEHGRPSRHRGHKRH